MHKAQSFTNKFGRAEDLHPACTVASASAPSDGALDVAKGHPAAFLGQPKVEHEEVRFGWRCVGRSGVGWGGVAWSGVEWRGGLFRLVAPIGYGEFFLRFVLFAFLFSLARGFPVVSKVPESGGFGSRLGYFIVSSFACVVVVR